MSPGQRFFGLALSLGAIGLMALASWLIPAEADRPGDWLFALLVGVIMGISVGAGAMLWFARIRCCAEGVIGWSFWGAPRFIAWSAIRHVRISHWMGAWTFVAHDRRAHVPFAIDRVEEFRRIVQQRTVAAATLAMDDPREISGECAHVGDLVRAAPGIVLVSAMVVVTTVLIAVKPDALALAAGAGVFLAAGPLCCAFCSPANDSPGRPATVRKLLRFGGWFLGLTGFNVLGQIANRRYDLENADGYTAFAWLFQGLGVAVLAFGLVLLMLRARRKEK